MNDMELDDLELELYKEFDAVVPDVFDDIMAKCEMEGLFTDGVNESLENEVPEIPAVVETAEEEETVKAIESEESNVIDFSKAKKGKKHRVAQWISIAASLVVILGGGYVGYAAYQIPSETIQIDVNPSIEMTVNPFGKVLSCEPINTDADPIVGTFNLKGKSYTYALEKITDAVIDAGYINDEKNTVLVSVIGKNTNRTDKISDRAASIVDNEIVEAGIDPCILYQTTTGVSGVEKFAEEAGVSEGKAIAAKRMSSILNNGSVYNVSKLSTTELGILVSEYGAISSKISYLGQANRTGYLTQDEAESVASTQWSSLGVINDTIKALLTVDDNGLVYLVSGQNTSSNYNLYVTAKVGTYAQNTIPTYTPSSVPSSSSNGTSSYSSQTQTGNGQSVTQETVTSDTDISTGTYISEDQAVNIATNHVVSNANDARIKNVSMIERNDRKIYRVSLEYCDLDYDIYVDAITGDIVGINIDG